MTKVTDCKEPLKVAVKLAVMVASVGDSESLRCHPTRRRWLEGGFEAAADKYIWACVKNPRDNPVVWMCSFFPVPDSKPSKKYQNRARDTGET